MNYWLMKSEPGEYSIDDLKRDKKTAWIGVRNYQARNFMRDSMNIGDHILFYHSNGKPSGIVGIGKVISDPYPDATQFDITSKYYYGKAVQENPVWVLVDIAFVKKFSGIVSIDQMRKEKQLQNMKTLQKGSRLSITPVTEKEFLYIERLAIG